jgi:hypothetical protein
VVDPPPTQGTIAVQCFPSELVNDGGLNSSGPPLQPPPPNTPPLVAEENKRNTTIHPVHSHAPLAIAQFFRNDRRRGRRSEARMTSETISEMNGMKKTAAPAAKGAHSGNGWSSASADGAPGHELVPGSSAEIDCTTGSSSDASGVS